MSILCPHCLFLRRKIGHIFWYFQRIGCVFCTHHWTKDGCKVPGSRCHYCCTHRLLPSHPVLGKTVQKRQKSIMGGVSHMLCKKFILVRLFYKKSLILYCHRRMCCYS